jgi:transposase
MDKKRVSENVKTRRSFTDEFKQEAVQMLLDGHGAKSVCDRLG